MYQLPCQTGRLEMEETSNLQTWHLVQSLTKDKATWEPMRDKVDPAKAAWEYSRRLWEATGLELIPPMPGEAPLPETPPALTGPMEVDGSDAPVSGSLGS